MLDTTFFMVDDDPSAAGIMKDFLGQRWMHGRASVKMNGVEFDVHDAEMFGTYFKTTPGERGDTYMIIKMHPVNDEYARVTEPRLN